MPSSKSRWLLLCLLLFAIVSNIWLSRRIREAVAREAEIRHALDLLLQALAAANPKTNGVRVVPYGGAVLDIQNGEALAPIVITNATGETLGVRLPTKLLNGEGLPPIVITNAR